jgi:hypothetical protein
MLNNLTDFKTRLQKTTFLSVALILALASLMPVLFSRHAYAAQITTRALTVSSAQPSATSVTYTIGKSTGGSDTTNGFFFGTSHIVKGLKMETCTTAVGTCTHPTGFSFASSGGYTLTGWQDATAFTKDSTNQNDCDGTNNQTLCLSRSSASSSEDTTHSHKIVVTGVVNQNNTNCSSNPNCTFFIRMSTYTNATYTIGSLTDSGTVASSTVQSLEVDAAVAEVLNFCIGTTASANNNATSNIAGTCSSLSGTAVNIGTLDTSSVNISPINTNGGNDTVGVAMLRTNAVNGATVSYDAIQASSGSFHLGSLRKSGVTCTNDAVPSTDNTDQCINSAGTTQTAFSAGTEKFGMTVAGINCGSTSSYSCTYASGTNHLTQSSNYVGGANGTTFGSSSAKGFAWDESGTAAQVASSTTVVDDEALILHFAATPSITTPFGAYLVQTDFIAVPTY